MITLRIIPPRLVGRGAQGPRDVTGLYFDAQRRHWSIADRALSLALSAGAAIYNLRSLDLRAWANGWSRGEEALNADAPDRIAHLGMAARKGLNRIVNPGAYPLDTNSLKNKRLFAARCRAAGLPVPQEFSGALSTLGQWLSGETAVVAKPNYASKGTGVVGYRRAGDAWSSVGRTMSDREVSAEIRALLGAGGIVQRACGTHPEMIELSPNALPTLRVMTAVNERGEIEVCGRVIRLSGGGPRAVDNFNAGNVVAPVDADGRAGAGFRRVGSKLERLMRHPTTGVMLIGAPLPDLAAAEALAIRAHEAFREGFRLIGWDIGLAAEGPVLVEGNWNPGTDILHLVERKGVGDTRLGALYRGWIDATPAEVWRSAGPIEREPRGSARNEAGMALADA